MQEISVSINELREKLRNDPRLKEEYIESVELPFAFATGNRFLKNYILEKTDYKPQSDLTSDWFQFSQLIEKFEVDQERLMVKYNEERDSHPPLMSRSLGR